MTYSVILWPVVSSSVFLCAWLEVDRDTRAHERSYTCVVYVVGTI